MIGCAAQWPRPRSSPASPARTAPTSPSCCSSRATRSTAWSAAASTEKFDRIEHLRDRITLHQGDLLDQRSLVDALRAARPDEIYNLAAMSFVAVSWIQPTLTAEFTGVGVTRMLEAMREVCPEARFYQASAQRDVRQGARGPADRGDALLPALALRRGQGLRPLHHGQLPRVLRPARDERDPLQPRVAAPRPGVRDAQDHLARGRDQARHARQAARSATSTPSATGATPRTTSRRCGSCSSRTSAEDYVIATGADAHGPRVRRGRLRRGRARRLGALRRDSTRASCARPRSTC